MASVLDTANALITLAELKAYLADDSNDSFITDTDNDNELEYLINGASRWANEYTGVDLLAREHTEYYDGDGSNKLYLDNFPVISAIADIDLYVDIDRAYAASSKIADADVILYADIGKIMLDGEAFDKAPQSVKIVYTAGHGAAADPSDVPDDIKYAIKLVCASMWKNKKDRLTGVSTLTVDGQSITVKEESIPTLAKELLNEHARDK